MLLFIQLPSTLSDSSSVISIHLMLLFIFKGASKSAGSANFNTSHVTVYLLQCVYSGYKVQNFNTSHVTVYRYTRSSPTSSNLISIHLMLLFIPLKCCATCSSSTFQYISCYCLSETKVQKAVCAVAFQYISCYCLSKSQTLLRQITGYFNTSHVTVYHHRRKHIVYLYQFQYISCYCLSYSA